MLTANLASSPCCQQLLQDSLDSTSPSCSCYTSYEIQNNRSHLVTTSVSCLEGLAPQMDGSIAPSLTDQRYSWFGNLNDWVEDKLHSWSMPLWSSLLSCPDRTIYLLSMNLTLHIRNELLINSSIWCILADICTRRGRAILMMRSGLQSCTLNQMTGFVMKRILIPRRVLTFLCRGTFVTMVSIDDLF